MFLCYAGSEEYARRYRYRWADRWLNNRPTLIGAYRQGGTWGLAFATPATEPMLLRNDSDLLWRILRRLSRIAALTGARRIRVAGVLPSHLHRMGHPLGNSEIGNAIASVVHAAIDRTRAKAGLSPTTPLVLLGGRGYVGSLVAQRLEQAGRPCQIVDLVGGSSRALPLEPTLLVDMSRSGAVDGYMKLAPRAPSCSARSFPSRRGDSWAPSRPGGSRVFHIAGVAAKMYPPLPGKYAGAIPCCAILSDGDPGVVLCEM